MPEKINKLQNNIHTNDSKLLPFGSTQQNTARKQTILQTMEVLLYVATLIRPDIACIVNLLGRKMNLLEMITGKLWNSH